jgi:hypothetical protein
MGWELLPLLPISLLVVLGALGWIGSIQGVRTHRADLRNLRHLAEGQAELQKEVRELRSRLAVANAALKDCRGALSDCLASGAVRASRDVH